MATSRRRLTSVTKASPKQDIVDYAREVIRTEAEALSQLTGRLNGAFARGHYHVLRRRVTIPPPFVAKQALTRHGPGPI